MSRRRGALPGVVRALFWGADDPFVEEAFCPRCGAPLDFARADPAALGRAMQGCTNRACPDHVSRPVPVRHP